MPKKKIKSVYMETTSPVTAGYNLLENGWQKLEGNIFVKEYGNKIATFTFGRPSIVQIDNKTKEVFSLQKLESIIETLL